MINLYESLLGYEKDLKVKICDIRDNPEDYDLYKQMVLQHLELSKNDVGLYPTKELFDLTYKGIEGDSLKDVMSQKNPFISIAHLYKDHTLIGSVDIQLVQDLDDMFLSDVDQKLRVKFLSVKEVFRIRMPFIKEDLRRKGYGKFFLEKCIERYKCCLASDIKEDNYASSNLYTSLGYSEICVYYNNKEKRKVFINF